MTLPIWCLSGGFSLMILYFVSQGCCNALVSPGGFNVPLLSAQYSVWIHQGIKCCYYQTQLYFHEAALVKCAGENYFVILSHVFIK